MVWNGWKDAEALKAVLPLNSNNVAGKKADALSLPFFVQRLQSATSAILLEAHTLRRSWGQSIPRATAKRGPERKVSFWAMADAFKESGSEAGKPGKAAARQLTAPNWR